MILKESKISPNEKNTKILDTPNNNESINKVKINMKETKPNKIMKHTITILARTTNKENYSISGDLTNSKCNITYG
jgi:hypothetical protein